MTQLTLFDIEGDGKKAKKRIDIRRAIRLAETKYRDDESVRAWLKIYRDGTPDIKVKKEKIKGIPPKSEFAKKGLINAVKLREEGKVMEVASAKKRR